MRQNDDLLRLAKDIPTAVAALAEEITADLRIDWRKAWARAAGRGLLRMTMPRALGGFGHDASTYLDAIYALGKACPDNGFTMGLNSQLWTVQQPLVAFGSDAQVARYLPDLVAGHSIGAYAATEEGSGSDALALQTRAEAKDGGYVLNGAKTLIGMATVCDIMLVFASTAPERKSWGLSAFIVEAGDAGLTRGPAQPKLGLTTLPLGQLCFDDCWIPEDRRLGPEGAGARIFQATLDWERAFILAPHVGAMARQLEQCVEFARTRETFGKPIIEHQSVSNRIADMAVRLKTSKLMMAEAARCYDRGRPLTAMAAMTNLHLSEAFLASSTDAMRTLGGAAYTNGSQAGIDVTDALGGVIYSGTSDVQRQIITRTLAHRRDS